jgi:hypothetical protein
LHPQWKRNNKDLLLAILPSPAFENLEIKTFSRTFFFFIKKEKLFVGLSATSLKLLWQNNMFVF